MKIKANFENEMQRKYSSFEPPKMFCFFCWLAAQSSCLLLFLPIYTTYCSAGHLLCGSENCSDSHQPSFICWVSSVFSATSRQSEVIYKKENQKMHFSWQILLILFR
jgi:hypothetical protein